MDIFGSGSQVIILLSVIGTSDQALFPNEYKVKPRRANQSRRLTLGQVTTGPVKPSSMNGVPYLKWKLRPGGR